MADFDINLVIKDGVAIGQIRQVRNELDKTEKKALSVRSAIRTLGIGIGVTQVVREFISLSNASSTIENRLKLVADTVGDTEAAFQRLRDISRQTRSPLEENVALFQRAAQAQRELGASNEDLYKFVQATGTALAIQGGTANTARGALIQLSQAIGATVVRAEEFNSILEGALPLAQAAARGIDEAGGSVARLRQLVITGKVSSKEFFQAIVEQQEYLQELFAKTEPTLSQAFTVLRNEAIATFRVFDQGTGITTILANVILLVADNLELVARILAAGTIAAGLLAIPTIIGYITTAVYALTAAIAANPLGALLTALTVGISLLIAFGDKMSLLGEGAATVADFMVVVWNRAMTFIGGLFNWVGSVFDAVFGTKIDGFTFGGFIKNAAYAIDWVVALFKGAGAAVVAIWENGAALIERALLTAFANAAKGVEAFLNFAIKGLNALGANIEEFDFSAAIFSKRDAVLNGQNVGEAFSDAFATSLENGSAQAAVQSIFDEAEERAQARKDRDEAAAVPPIPPSTIESFSNAGKAAGGAKKSFAELYAEMERDAEALTKLGQEQDIYNKQMEIAEKIGRSLTAAEAEAVAQMVKKIEVLQAASDIYDDLTGRMREYMNTQAALNQLLSTGAISELEAAVALSRNQLVQDLAELDKSLGGSFAYQAEIQAVRDMAAERTLILQQAREADLINEEDYQARLRALTAATNRELIKVEADRWDFAIQSASDSLGSILSYLEQYGDKSSGTYKAIFLAQKAFAIAEATVNTARAVSNALAAPFPPPIPQTLATAAAVAGGAQIAAIIATTITGLKEGGIIGQVRGAGGPKDDRAGLFALSNGEFVVNAEGTRDNLALLEAINRGADIRGLLAEGGTIRNADLPQLRNAGRSDVDNVAASRPNRSQSEPPNVEVPVNIINVDKKEAALSAMASQGGKDVILNMLENDAPRFRAVLGLRN